MMYLPAKAQVLLSARCHKVGFSQQSWVLMICLSPEAQHYDFEECSVFGWHKQTPDASTSHAELVTSNNIQYGPLIFACTSTHSNAPVHDMADLYWHMHTTCRAHAQHMHCTCMAHDGTCTAHAWLIATVVSFLGWV